MSKRGEQSQQPQTPSGSSIVFRVGGDAIANAVGDRNSVNVNNITARSATGQFDGLDQAFAQIRQAIAVRPTSQEVDKDEISHEVQQLAEEAKKGEKADQTTLKYHLRAIRRMAPDILEVMVAAFESPTAAIATVIRKIALKVKEEAAQTKTD
ncbi:MAG: hypothetical protein ACYDBJ_13285 [Aggregatilineales bacterium]